ncbi:MAG: ABC transporter permease [Planctomycetaceae bacterium]
MKDSHTTSGWKAWLHDRWHTGDLAPVISLLSLLAIFTVLIGPSDFLSLSTASRVLDQGAVLAIASVGLTFVLLTAEIDLAVGKIAVLAACVCGVLFEQSFAAGPAGQKESGMSVLSLLAVLAMPFVIALVAGSLSGVMTVSSRLPSFIITLAMMFVCEGLAKYLTKGVTFKMPALLKSVGNDGVLVGGLSIPFSAMLATVVMLVGHVVLQHTRFGRYVYMTGGNREAARLAGVRTPRIVVACLVISGLTAALAGLVNAGRLESIGLEQNTDLLLNAVACVVLGGTSLFGGEGSMPRTLIGVLTFTVLKVGLDDITIEGFKHFDLLRPFVLGIVLLVALFINGRIARGRS